MAKKTKTRAQASSNDKSWFTTIFENIHNETSRFIVGIIIFGIALFLIYSMGSFLINGGYDQSITENFRMDSAITDGTKVQNANGSIGAKAAEMLINGCFGIPAFIIPLFLIILSLKMMKTYELTLWKWFVSAVVILEWTSLLLAFLFEHTPLSHLTDDSFILMGGRHGLCVNDQYIMPLLGIPGLIIILAITAILYMVYLSNETIILIRKILNPNNIKKVIFTVKKGGEEEEPAQAESFDYNTPTEEAPLYDDQPSTVTFETSENDAPDAPSTGKIEFEVNNHEETVPTVNKEEGADSFEVEAAGEEEKASAKAMGPYDPKLDLEHYKYPTLDLLIRYKDNGPKVDMNEQNANKDRIINVLRNFGVEISSIKATVGPTITLYEITPAQGIRIAKIKNLEDDIALGLSALGIRIIAPIPGKGTIGIEVPNANPQIVSMESIINSRKFQESNFELPIALGKTITNEVFMVDLAKMPHLLVAGATGQGKSVGLNAIITSLLYKKHPAELKLVMVDPKKVEFSIYSPLERHFLAKVGDDDEEPIITDVQKVIRTLKSLCAEMDSRYDLLKKAKARNLKEYNAKFKARELNPENGHKFLPYIVVIIDEFGDLIMTAGKEIELPIARIAQLARAVGIHMVIATQRPTTNIITGTIKANFPARMAFRVGAMIDSRTILDRPGANQLIGRGDMLFLSGGEPVRVQCAFVDTPEVEKINQFICTQQGYGGAFELPEVKEEGGDNISADGFDPQKLDPMFEEAARAIVSTQQGSTSMIQRKFSIGYNRAGRLMDQLEKVGVVGAQSGSKPREVLISDEASLDRLLSTLR